MIRVVMAQDATGWSVRMDGHAGTAPHGQDLVCAAASMLVYALAARVRELQADGRVDHVIVEMQSGSANVIANYMNGCYEALDGAFETIMAGLRLLEKQHGDAIACDYLRS